MNKWTERLKAPVMGLACLMMAGSSLGEPVTWNGTQNGNWFEAGNWTPAGLPAAGADVVYTNAGASLILTNATPILSSFTMNNGTVTCSNWFTRIQATHVTIEGGTITLPVAFTNTGMSNRIHIVCDTLTVAQAATLDADGKGYASTNGPGGTLDAGGGLGGSGGAGHGGMGGTAASGFLGGNVYGDPVNPGQPGSGAGKTTSSVGGTGGGVIRLDVAGHASLDGLVSAKGANGNAGPAYRHGGGGSGGSILLICETLSGSGALQANGGNGVVDVYHGGGGGGGRIALHFDPVEQALLPRPDLTISAAPGVTAFPPYDWLFWKQADWGTLYFTDLASIVDLNAEVQRLAGYLHTPDVTQLDVESLTIGPGAALGFDADMTLVVTQAVNVATNAAFIARGRLTLDCGGSFTNLGKVWLSGTNALAIDGDLILPGTNARMSVNAPTLDVGGDLRVDGAALSVSAASVAVVGVGTGGTVTVAGDLVLVNGGWVYPYAHQTNGGAVRFACDHLSIDATSGFEADGKGYAPRYGPGATMDAASFDGGSGGAGHGGVGGATAGLYLGGIVYGDPVRPRHAGSGAGNTTSALGGPGGGVIWINAVNGIQLDGALTACGKKGGSSTAYRWGGGGAGGSILLECKTISGSGVIRADGADGVINALFHGGGGGGGRVAVHFDTVEQALLPHPGFEFSVKPGATAFPLFSRHYWLRADWGSLFMTDIDALVDLTPPVGGIAGYLLEPGLAQRDFAHLSIQPGSALGFDTNMTLAVTGGILIPSNAAFLARHPLQLTCDGSVTNRGRLSLGGETVFSITGDLDVDGTNAEAALNRVTLTVGGNVRVRDFADLRLFGAPTNGLPGAVGGNVTVTGDIRIETGAGLHPYSDSTNGGSVRIASRNLFVDSSSGVYANYMGFAPQSGPGTTVYSGSTSGGSGGAGHGGAGGAASSGYAGGKSYGSRDLPCDAGSGAGNSQQSPGGAGGGVIWIDVDEQVLLDGPMTADGENGRYGGGNRFSGGGAGGSIQILCKRLTGGGDFSAIGGNGYVSGIYASGGGGGGRIAIWYGLPRALRQPMLDNLGSPSVQSRILETPAVSGFGGTFSGVAGGDGYVDGAPGTQVFYRLLTSPGTLILIQ